MICPKTRQECVKSCLNPKYRCEEKEAEMAAERRRQAAEIEAERLGREQERTKNGL